jgi:hypothetical protein
MWMGLNQSVDSLNRTKGLTLPQTKEPPSYLKSKILVFVLPSELNSNFTFWVFQPSQCNSPGSPFCQLTLRSLDFLVVIIIWANCLKYVSLHMHLHTHRHYFFGGWRSWVSTQCFVLARQHCSTGAMPLALLCFSYFSHMVRQVFLPWASPEP